jgi:hypothetical protein
MKAGILLFFLIYFAAANTYDSNEIQVSDPPLKSRLLHKIEQHLDTVSTITYDGIFRWNNFYDDSLTTKNMKIYAVPNPANFYGWDTELVEETPKADTLHYFHMMHKAPDFYTNFTDGKKIITLHPYSYSFNASGYYGFMWYLFHIEQIIDRALSSDAQFKPVDYPSDCMHCIVFGFDTVYEQSGMSTSSYIFIDSILLLPVRTLTIDSSHQLQQSKISEVVLSNFEINTPFPEKILNPDYYRVHDYEYRGPAYFATNREKEEQARKVRDLDITVFYQIELTDKLGNTFYLDQAENQWLLIDFWFLSCYPCMLSLHQLNEYQQDGLFPNLQIIALNGTDKGLEVLEPLEARGIQFQAAKIPKTILSDYGIRSHPRHLLINPQRELVADFTGYHATMDSLLRSYMD